MTDKNKSSDTSTDGRFNIKNQDNVVKWISQITSKDESVVRERLRKEFECPGYNVSRAFTEAGLVPFVWSDELEKFYEGTDAFIYELVIWNLNRLKRRMRKYVSRYLADRVGQGLKVLCIGDGLGFDSLHLAERGHKVTYFEVPGFAHSFAGRLFENAGADVKMISDNKKITQNYFDVVICLDVLEHVPNVPDFVTRLSGYIRDNGIFVVHAPFYMVHPSNPTHLKVNRKYSGSLGVYHNSSLRLINGDFFWNPLIFEKSCNKSRTRNYSASRVIAIRLAGLFLSLGRFSNFPFFWIDSYRKKHNRWFE